jgi:DNA-binding PadR family transcriptional regulator
MGEIYRALADLEAQGAVRSELTPGDGGGRKVYELTDVGWNLFAFWQRQFKEEQRDV